MMFVPNPWAILRIGPAWAIQWVDGRPPIVVHSFHDRGGEMQITDNDTETLEAIRKWREKQWWSGPSVRDLAEILGLSINATHRRLVRLKEKGLVDWKPGEARGVRLVE